MAEHAQEHAAAAEMREQGTAARQPCTAKAAASRLKNKGCGFPFQKQTAARPLTGARRRIRFTAAQERGRAQSKACAM